MATHPIGPGTRNLSVNVRQNVHATLGRVALQLDISVGNLVRKLMRLGAHVWHSSIRAERAAQLDEQALVALRLARSSESDGGLLVTDAEAASIERLLRESARLDHRISRSLDLKEINR